MKGLRRRLERVAGRVGHGERGPTVIAHLDGWPEEGRAAYARAVSARDLLSQEDLLERHHGVRPRLAAPDGRPLPDAVRSIVVLFDVRPDGPQ